MTDLESENLKLQNRKLELEIDDLEHTGLDREINKRQRELNIINSEKDLEFKDAKIRAIRLAVWLGVIGVLVKLFGILYKTGDALSVIPWGA